MNKRRRAITWSVVGSFVLLLVFVAAWVGIRGLAARAELMSALPEVRNVATLLVSQDFDGASESLARAQQSSENARGLVSDPIWRASEWVPWVGGNFTVVRELAEVTDDVLDEAVEPALDAARALDPASLRPVDGRIPLEPIVEAVDAAQIARDVIVDADSRVDASMQFDVIGPVERARTQLAEEIDDVLPQVRIAADAASLLPGMLGAEGPRNYLIMFMNNAELRALGGTALSFTTISIDNGAFTIGDAVPAGFNNFSRYEPGELRPVPEGVEDLYPLQSFGTYIPNVTMTPQFPIAADLARSMWLEDIGTPVDAVIGLDTAALSYAMRGLDDVPLADGSVLSSGNAVQLLLNDIYLRYPTEVETQDLLYGQAVSGIAGQVSSGSFEPGPLLEGLARAGREGRLLMWSTVAEEQALFEAADIDGAPPAATDERAEFGVYLQDGVGAKLNYYLDLNVGVRATDCSDGMQSYELALTVTNTIPPGRESDLGPSILGNFRAEGLAPGVQRLLVYVFAPPMAVLGDVFSDGDVLPSAGARDGSNPATRVTVELAPGESAELTTTVAITSSEAHEDLAILSTPLATPTEVSIAPCGG